MQLTIVLLASLASILDSCAVIVTLSLYAIFVPIRSLLVVTEDEDEHEDEHSNESYVRMSDNDEEIAYHVAVPLCVLSSGCESSVTSEKKHCERSKTLV